MPMNPIKRRSAVLAAIVVSGTQHFGGLGLRWAPLRGPGLTIELRNHHISNAGTAGENLGVNAGTEVAGVQWIFR
jgi:hypothetical protein